jgi:F0F1-type ATP synthase epsilon subunit
MKLIIVTPESSMEHEVVWIEINTPEGNFVIQAGHIETTFALSPHQPFLYCFKTGKKEIIKLEKPGILNVTKEHIMALL